MLNSSQSILRTLTWALIVTKVKISLGKLQPLARIVKENWGFPLIIGFMILLIVAAVLRLRWVFTAEIIGDIAYFVLAAGVVIQFVCLTRKRRKEAGVNYGSS